MNMFLAVSRKALDGVGFLICFMHSRRLMEPYPIIATDIPCRFDL